MVPRKEGKWVGGAGVESIVCMVCVVCVVERGAVVCVWQREIRHGT